MINTILVIDENTFNNAMLRNILCNVRYNTISALTAQQAIQFIENRNVDIILLDLSLPELENYEFLEKFKQTSYYQTIPLIIVADADKTDIIEKVMTEYEIFDFVTKPIDSFKSHDSIYNLIFINKIKTALRYRSAIRALSDRSL